MIGKSQMDHENNRAKLMEKAKQERLEASTLRFIRSITTGLSLEDIGNGVAGLESIQDVIRVVKKLRTNEKVQFKNSAYYPVN